MPHESRSCSVSSAEDDAESLDTKPTAQLTSDIATLSEAVYTQFVAALATIPTP